MILAAGLGTRLRPLTYVRPKVLVPIQGMRMLDFWVHRLYSQGYEAVVVNAFYLGEQVCRAAREASWPIPVEVRVEDRLLGTGGGLRNVLDFFDGEPLTIINGDVICDVDLKMLREAHETMGSTVTFLMHDFPPFNNVAVSREGFILGFGDRARAMVGENTGVLLEAFTGIHVVNPETLEHIPCGEPYEILTLYERLIRERRPPRAVYREGMFWREMGSINAYTALTRELAENFLDTLYPLKTGNKVVVHPGARVATDVVFKGLVMVGKGCVVGNGVRMQDTILWDNVRVLDGTDLMNCIVADDLTVSGRHSYEVITGAVS